MLADPSPTLNGPLPNPPARGGSDYNRERVLSHPLSKRGVVSIGICQYS